MVRKFIFIIFLLSSYLIGLTQVTTDPALPVAPQKVTIIFDSSKESRLGYFTGDLYAHTGVIIEGETDWQYVIESWGNNTTQPKLTNKGNGIYELEIAPDINTFYSVPQGKKVVQMAFVFRSSNSSQQTDDIFVEVFEEGLAVDISMPDNNSIINKGETIGISADASLESDLSLFIDTTLIHQSTGTVITTNNTFNEAGNFWVIAEAQLTGETVRDSVFVCIKEDIITEEKPSNLKKGINYIDGQTAALVLWAPDKEFVFVVGDFSSWQPRNEFQMKKDGDFFWLEIDNLETGKEYIFQYLIDGEIQIADPYTEKTSDPNDQWILGSTYPNLIQYPDGMASSIASVLQTGQEIYDWQVQDFQTPSAESLVIYEMLIRDFTSEHTYQSVIDKLDYLEDLNINVLELMPVNEFEGNSSWGYNPSFYFAPDKYYGLKNNLKKLIDECHKRDIAVVIDLVLNHSYGQSPLVKMYWDDANNRPAANNPWYNSQHNFQNTDAQWGYDFNHESQATKELVDSINSFWIKEYKVDGFRFDFTKGFSNTAYGSSSWGSNYDAVRIANLKRMADEIWKRKSDALVIFEHLSDNAEEKELSSHGILLWGNMNHNYSEASMGYNESNKSNLEWGVYDERGWNQPNLVTYMESHDEERLMYKNFQYGNSTGNYTTRSLSTALDRIELNSVFFIPLPGPKMIWQFGELGYDFSINYNGRLGEKPVRWDYLEETDRTDLFQVMAKLNYLKQTYPEFIPDEIIYDLDGEIKTYRLSKGNDHVVAIGNFDVIEKSATVNFPTTGTWYEYFSKSAITVNSGSKSFSLAPGEYKLFSTREFADPHVQTDLEVETLPGITIKVFPNPAVSKITIESEIPFAGIAIKSIAGNTLFAKKYSSKMKTVLDISKYPPGIYFITVNQGNKITTKKCIKR